MSLPCSLWRFVGLLAEVRACPRRVVKMPHRCRREGRLADAAACLDWLAMHGRLISRAFTSVPGLAARNGEPQAPSAAHRG